MRSVARKKPWDVAVFLLTATVSNACGACDLSSLKGEYWFVGNGTSKSGNAASNPVNAFAEIGRVSYDGKGGATLAETVALHAGQSEVKASGTYIVYSDCRAAVQWKDSKDQYLESYAVIILPGGNELPTLAFRVAQAGGSRTLSQFSQKRI